MKSGREWRPVFGPLQNSATLGPGGLHPSKGITEYLSYLFSMKKISSPYKNTHLKGNCLVLWIICCMNLPLIFNQGCHGHGKVMEFLEF